MSSVGLRSSTIIWPKTTFGPPSVGYSRASNPFSAKSRRTNAAVSGCAFLCAEIVGKRQYSLRTSRALSESASTRASTSLRTTISPRPATRDSHKNSYDSALSRAARRDNGEGLSSLLPMMTYGLYRHKSNKGPPPEAEPPDLGRPGVGDRGSGGDRGRGRGCLDCVVATFPSPSETRRHSRSHLHNPHRQDRTFRG